MTDVLVPQFTPDSDAYLNEADFREPDYQRTFYGGHDEALSAIKNKYDPNHIFYALAGVGSDYWTPAADGRLCKSQS